MNSPNISYCRSQKVLFCLESSHKKVMEIINIRCCTTYNLNKEKIQLQKILFFSSLAIVKLSFDRNEENQIKTGQKPFENVTYGVCSLIQMKSFSFTVEFC